jgi:pimeloyl-ACP methyl ester carboxylesterase
VAARKTEPSGLTPTQPGGALVREERTSFVDAGDGTRIFYRVTGDGPTVALCDGILCEGFVWKYLRPYLAQRCRVVHWNYRGHGRSGRPRDPARIGIRDHADDLWRVLDAAGVDRAVLVGHSMGTQVCLEGYRAAPERVAGLVLVCGSYGRITRTFHGTDALAKVLPSVLRLRERYPRVIRGLVAMMPTNLALRVARMSREIDPIRTRAEDMLPYFEHLAGMDPDTFLRMLDAAGTHSAEDLLRTITVPTLVIAAECDSFTPSRLAEQMADQIPGADFMFVREGSHSCPIEQPDLINLCVEKFLVERAYPAELNAARATTEPESPPGE